MKNLTSDKIGLLLLSIIIIFMVLSKGNSNKTNSDFDDLHIKNDSLLKENAKLKIEKDSIDKHVKYLESLVSDKVKEINSSTDKINQLKNNKDEISNYIDTLPNDSIANAFTKYLERRKS